MLVELVLVVVELAGVEMVELVLVELVLVAVELAVVEMVELVLVELVLVAVELAVVELVELVLVELVLVAVELMVSSSTTAVSDSVPFTLSLLTCSTAIALFATVCSLIVICLLSCVCSISSVCSFSCVCLISSVCSFSCVCLISSVCSLSFVGAAGVDPEAGKGAGAVDPRGVVDPGTGPDAILSACLFLGVTSVLSNCESTLDNADWL